MKDECCLCGRVLPLYSLKRCLICKRFYCRSCMTTNLWSEQRDLICLNCARRIVAPKHSNSKYGPLREQLRRRGQFTSLVTVTFSQIEAIIRNDLPSRALENEKWWKNSATTAQGHAWTSAGWTVQSVDLKGRSITFKKSINTEELQPSRKRRRKAKNIEKPFAPIPVKPLRILKPSKTKIAKVIARARNVERRRTTVGYRGKFKLKSPYEKRLFKPEAKPKLQG